MFLRLSPWTGFAFTGNAFRELMSPHVGEDTVSAADLDSMIVILWAWPMLVSHLQKLSGFSLPSSWTTSMSHHARPLESVYVI